MTTNSDELPTPARMLDERTALNMTELAYVTGGLFTKGRKNGEPDRRRGCELVEAGGP